MAEHISDEYDRKLNKIKKCLALSKSPNPHEAAQAMRHAQAMMKELGVNEDVIDGLDIKETLVKTREGFGKCYFVAHLSNLIGDTFGVEHVRERNPGTANRLNIRYIGPAGRVQLAEYTHKVVQRAVDGAWEAYLMVYPHHKGNGGKREAFRSGWLMQIKAQVIAMEITEKEANAIARKKDQLYGSDLVVGDPISRGKLDNKAYYAGKRAAENFALHRPMGQENLKIGRG